MSQPFADKFYKVVTVMPDGKRLSFAALYHCPEFNRPHIQSGLILEYIPGKVTKPKIEGSKLFVCSAVADAYTLAGLTEQIWECEITNPSWVRNVPSLLPAPDSIHEFWHEGCEEVDKGKGLCVVDSVKLIRRVDNTEIISNISPV